MTESEKMEEGFENLPRFLQLFCEQHKLRLNPFFQFNRTSSIPNLQRTRLCPTEANRLFDDYKSIAAFHFADGKTQLGKKHMLQLRTNMREGQLALIFCKTTRHARDEIKHDDNIRVFDSSTFLFRKLESNLVPRYEVVSRTEIPGLVRSKMWVSLDRLPKILVSDPIARYMMWKRGTVVFLPDRNIYKYVK